MLFSREKKISLTQKGLLQASGVAAYIFLVSLAIRYGKEIFGQMENIAGPAAFLTLFSVSALICGLLVFYHPYQLLFSGKKKAAADLVLLTTAYLAGFFLLFLFLNALLLK